MKDTQSTPDKDQVNKLRDSILYELKYSLGVTLLTASSSDVFSALALVVRRNQVDDYFSTQERHYQAKKKTYLLYIDGVFDWSVITE